MFLLFPYRIDRPFRMPWATIALIATNILLFVFSIFTGLDWTIQTLGFRLNVWAPLSWLTASFLHGGFGHIAGNMYFLWLFGSVVEDALGPWRLVGVYLAGGFASAMAHGVMMAIFLPESLGIPMIGASGALAAIMGLFAVRFYRTKIRVWYLVFIRPGTFSITSVAGIALWFARDVFDGMLGLAFGVLGGVANWAHLGGVAFGVGLGLLSGQVRSAAREYLAEDAEKWSAAGTHAVAAAKYAELAEADPQNPEWRRRRARELADSFRDNPSETAAEYAEAVRLFVSQRRNGDALDALTEAEPRVGPLAIEPQVLLSVAAEAERRAEWARAAELYLRVIHERGGTPSAEKALFRLAHVYLGGGDMAQATTTWGAFRDIHPHSQWGAFADPALTALDAG